MHWNQAIALFLTLTAAVPSGAGGAESSVPRVFTSDASGFHTHSFWYDDGQEVTVVDTQFTPELARQLVAEIRAKTHSPITGVVVTHPNPDKFNALSVFHALGARSIASAKTAAAIPGVDAYKRYYWTQIAKAFTEATYPKVEPIQETYVGQRKIQLKSGETLTLSELGQPGVSSNQTVVRIDRTGDLIVGDLVANGAHLWLEGGIVNGKPHPTLSGWKADLQELLRLGNGSVYGGRGGALPVRESVKAELAYLEKADAIVTGYVRALGPKGRELSDPAKSQGHFRAIQAEFEKAFPGVLYPELIGYGVYGLALSKLPAGQ